MALNPVIDTNPVNEIISVWNIKPVIDINPVTIME
jgi:hypothetical protein